MFRFRASKTASSASAPSRSALARTSRRPASPIAPRAIGATVFGLAALAFFIGGGYVYSVNGSAVQGYAMRQTERQLSELKKRNAELRLAEAEVRELSRITRESGELRMERISQISELTYPGTVAFR